MNTFIIIAMTLLFAYTLTICVVNRGIPNSLSATVYALPPKGAWLWTLVIGAASCLTMPVILEVSPESFKFLGFLAIVGLLLVALCPLDPKKNDFTYEIHLGGAIVCAVCSQLLIAVAMPLLLLVWVPWLVAYVVISRRRKWKTAIFFAEMTCFADTFAFCLMC